MLSENDLCYFSGSAARSSGTSVSTEQDMGRQLSSPRAAYREAAGHTPQIKSNDPLLHITYPNPWPRTAPVSRLLILEREDGAGQQHHQRE